MFEPFFTTKGENGTGLGLSSVKATVESWSGSIRCTSEPEAGTTFEIHVPLAETGASST